MSCRYPESLLLRNWSAMSSNFMKSLRFTEFGPPSVLRIEEVAIPDPGVGEALVQVKAAAINPSDIGNVAGRFKSTTLPRTPGRDFAGIVVRGVRDEGAEVWGSSGKLGIVRDGSHAEYVVVPAQPGLAYRAQGYAYGDQGISSRRIVKKHVRVTERRSRSEAVRTKSRERAD